MFKEWLIHLRHPGRRAFVIGLAVLTILLALGGGLWRSLQPRHVPTVPNQGNSLLYISTSVAAGLNGGSEDTLTMFRTSDGKELWHYHLPGALSTVLSRTDSAVRAGTAVEVVNGVVYFLIDTNPQSYPNASLHQLMALRASDGSLLWQQQIQTGLAELITVGDGVVCIELTPKKNTYSADSLTLQGHRADTGAFVWQRQWSDLVGKYFSPFSLINLDGLLYVTTSIPAVMAPGHTHIVAVQLNTGQTRWSYEAQQTYPFSTFPLFSSQGLVIFALGVGDPIFDPATFHTDLAGFDESSGTLRWRYHLPGFLTNNFSRQQGSLLAGLGFQQDTSVLYLPTVTETCCAIAVTSFSITALRIVDGRQLWQHTLAQGGARLLDTMLANGTLYLAYDLTTGAGRNTLPTDIVIAALQTSDGAQRWQNRTDQLAYTTLTAAPDGLPTLVHSDTISELQSQDGSTRWQQTITSGEHIIFLRSAGDKLVASYQDTNPEGGAGLDHLCALEPATGHILWCHIFNTQVSWLELGP